VAAGPDDRNLALVLVACPDGAAESPDLDDGG